MIGYLSGKIYSVKPNNVIIDVNGVGYLVNISLTTFEEISKLSEVKLIIHTHVREDAIVLFGFSKESEKEMFELLLTVNGIGAKLALGVLSGIQVNELKNAIMRNDLPRIIAIPGIGKKTAERLVLELKGKIDSIGASTSSSEPFYAIRSEASSALVSLGYDRKTADKITGEVFDANPGVTIENLLKLSLKRLNS